MFILQTNNPLADKIPTFSEIVKYYGPYLGLVLVLLVAILVLQFIWFSRLLNAKNDEIKRAVEREQELNDRILHMIDEEIGYRKKK